MFEHIKNDAGVAEWQTREIQNLLSSRVWGFKSPPRHQSVSLKSRLLASPKILSFTVFFFISQPLFHEFCSLIILISHSGRNLARPLVINPVFAIQYLSTSSENRIAKSFFNLAYSSQASFDERK